MISRDTGSSIPPRGRKLVLHADSGRITDEHGQTVAVWRNQSVLDDAGWKEIDGDGPPMVVWSGSFAQVDPEDDNDGVGSGVEPLFRADPRTWMAGFGWKALADALARFSTSSVSPATTDGPSDRRPRLILRTHARHVLSDTPSTFRFLKDPAFAAFDVLVDAPALLTPAMLEQPTTAADHLTRIVEDVLSPACPRRPFAVLLGQVGLESEHWNAEIAETERNSERTTHAVRRGAARWRILPPNATGVLPTSLVQSLERDLIESGVDAVHLPAAG